MVAIFFLSGAALIPAPVGHVRGDLHVDQGAPALAAVEAFLYYYDSGTLSPNIIDNPDFKLWNVNIGAGSATGRSNATFVKVTVAGPPNRYLRDLVLVFEARVGDTILVDRSTPVGIFGSAGRYYGGYWLYDTGCDPVVLTVALRGQRAPVTKRIDFDCGE
jgi:hypothetical protein